MNIPTQNAQISSIVSEIDSAAKAIRDGEEEIKKARKRTLLAARNLVATLEDPVETVFKHAFSGPDRVCVRFGVQLRLFHAVAGREGRPISAAELAESSGAEELFIVRIMRILTGLKFVGEAGPESYIATPITKAMTIPPIDNAVKSTYSNAFQIFNKTPTYFEKNGYKCPTDPLDTAFQLAMDTKLGFYDYIEQDPKAFKDFDTFMKSSRHGRPVFVDWFPVKERILDGYESGSNQPGESPPDEVLIVDVGGGTGQDLERFKKTFPQAPGRLILEDTPSTVAKVNFGSPGMETIPYDFFKPQPVKGARTYFLRYVTHNWPDHLVASILRNTASAMKPGYSNLLVQEYIVPATGCPIQGSWADFHMMTSLAGCERTEKQFHELFASAGLKVVKFWYPEGSFDGVVEAVLDDEKATGSDGVGQVESNGHGEVGQINGL